MGAGWGEVVVVHMSKPQGRSGARNQRPLDGKRGEGLIKTAVGQSRWLAGWSY